MVNVQSETILEVLRTVPDPEMPISIVDLGLIEHVRVFPGDGGARVEIDVLPTFVGCPALDMIRDDVEEKVRSLDGVRSVRVEFIHDPPWSVSRITEEGRRSLREHGVTVPATVAATGPGHGASNESGSVAVTLTTTAIPCPFCGSTSTALDSVFGPTRCRMIHYCNACRNTFEHMKHV